jgi:hypothetical protein
VAGVNQIDGTAIDVGYPMNLQAGQGSASFWLCVER